LIVPRISIIVDLRAKPERKESLVWEGKVSATRKFGTHIFIGPLVSQKNLTGILSDVCKCIEQMSQVLNWDVFWKVLSGVDPPVDEVLQRIGEERENLIKQSKAKLEGQEVSFLRFYGSRLERNEIGESKKHQPALQMKILRSEDSQTLRSSFYPQEAV